MVSRQELQALMEIIENITPLIVDLHVWSATVGKPSDSHTEIPLESIRRSE